MRNILTRTLQGAAVLVTLALLGSTALAGDCYSAAIAGPIMLPDGSTTVGGPVKVCRVKQLTPVSTLHSLSVGGRRVGMFLGTRQSVELGDAESTQPTMVFSRSGMKALEFRAIAYTVGGRYQAFRADQIGRGERVLTRDAFEMALAGDPGSMLVAVLAAD